MPSLPWGGRHHRHDVGAAPAGRQVVPPLPWEREAAAVGSASVEPLRPDPLGGEPVSGIVVGLIIGAFLIGVPAARYQRTTRARSDWVGAARVHKAARQTFWRELVGFIGAAAGRFLVLIILWWIGSH
jgi:hypothetical protein